MQRIYIKNFQAIKEADIEIKKVLILIGEQASGKSTIAKLIYFFQTLHDDFLNAIYLDNQKDYFDMALHFTYPTRRKFYDFFGSTFHLTPFEITYYYSDKIFIKLTLNEYKKLHVYFGGDLDKKSNVAKKFKNDISNIKRVLAKFQSQPKNVESSLQERSYIESLSNLFKKTFGVKITQNNVFVISGRSSTVAYGELFEKEFFNEVQRRININLDKSEKDLFEKAEQTIDAHLMYQFIKRVIDIKDIFKDNGFYELLGFDKKQRINKVILEKIRAILKGEYRNERYGEKIYFNDSGEYVWLRNTSSGQQEAIRILQDIFLVILKGENVSRIVEEPEAHLFPVAQKNLIELLALMVNQSEENQLIITTHSPYILTVLNNLLFYTRVCNRNPSAKEKIKQYFQTENLNENTNQRINILPEDFQAYSLSTSRESYCQSIFDEEIGLISENFLDMATESMNDDFDFLSSLNVSNRKLKL